ncbi:hypothetical protein ACGFZH_20870 [Streptomyces zaomyceticus]|uniref:hypothetical protein n=1 Tax=Streptomyces zaomyceticus TaxID=68286 RepID=UPI003719BC6D
MAFPQTPLDLGVELQIGGTWTDVTTDAYTRSPIGTECGRSEESARTNPSRCSLQFNNRLGKYSPRNPMSPYYGLIGRNTPVRISVRTGATYLNVTGQNNSGATTPDTAALDITGDIDIRFDASLDRWVTPLGTQPTDLAGKYNTTGNQRSWMLQERQGRIYFEWSPDGTATVGATSTVAPAVPPSRRMAWRATLDVNNGAGGWTAVFYTAETIAGPWTQLGAPVTGVGVTSIFNSTTLLKVGDATNLGYSKPSGEVHAFEVRNGIGGTAVANPDFTAQTSGAATVTDATGKVWTIALNGSISNRHTVFYGEISSWPTRWDLSGKDVWTSVEAAGTLRRLGQGTKALDSTLRRRLPSRSPLAYWPCEDADGATQAYSPLVGGTPLAVTGFDFAQDDSLGGASALPTVAPGATMRGRVASTASTTWALCMLYRADGTPPVAEQEMLSWTTTGTIRRWRILISSTSTRILGYDAAGAVALDSPIVTGTDLWEGWWRLEFAATQSGGNIAYEIDWTDVGGAGGAASGSIAGTVGVVALVDTSFGPGLPGLTVGHITVFAADVVGLAYDSADHGFTGETATTRMTRLATEESRTVSLSVYTDPAVPSMALGSQRPADLLTLLQDCADADGGILYESKTDASLAYRDVRSLYNQTPRLTLSYTADGEIGPPLEPTDDDQKSRNDVTVTRTAGSSARAVQETGPMSTAAPPSGIGVYDESVTLNLANDDQPAQIAAWRLHLGTWDEARYPTVRLMLHAAPHLIPAFLALTVGDRIRITNLPAWLPPGPVDLIVQGWSQVLDQFTWDVELTCTPAGPWRVGVYDSADLGKADTSGMQLTSGINSSATSFSVTTTAGLPWVTAPAEFPASIVIGGEEMTLTGVTGASSPQTFAVVRSANGIVKSHAAGTSVGLARSVVYAL